MLPVPALQILSHLLSKWRWASSAGSGALKKIGIVIWSNYGSFTPIRNHCFGKAFYLFIEPTWNVGKERTLLISNHDLLVFHRLTSRPAFPHTITWVHPQWYRIVAGNRARLHTTSYKKLLGGNIYSSVTFLYDSCLEKKYPNWLKPFLTVWWMLSPPCKYFPIVAIDTTRNSCMLKKKSRCRPVKLYHPKKVM